MHTSESITLRGMRFHSLVGVLPHEEQLPQPLEIDITVWVNKGRAAGRKAGAGPLDYRRLYSAVSDIVVAGPIRYLEDFVSRAADAALALDGVIRVRVAARKPHVALPGPVAYAEVAVERERDA